MGKRGKKPRKQKPCKESAVVRSSHGKGKYSVEQLLSQAEGCIDTFDYVLARRFCERALEVDPDHTNALETTGALLLEIGDMDAARNCFRHAVEVDPDHGHAKYMYLGQLLTGQSAIETFSTGIKLMTSCLEQQEASAASVDSRVSSTDVSNAYCSIVEIYLTDECFSSEAEAACKESLDKALSFDDQNPEVYQLLASFYLSKELTQEAKESILKGVNLWLPKLKEASKPDTAQDEPQQVCPVGYPFRLNAAKILIEVEEYECCTDVLELLLDEEDEVADVWYLLGWANYLQGDDYKSNARFYLNKAQLVITKVGCEDEGIVEHTKQLLDELGPGDDNEEEEEEEGESSGNESDVEAKSEDGMEVTDETMSEVHSVDNVASPLRDETPAQSKLTVMTKEVGDNTSRRTSTDVDMEL